MARRRPVDPRSTTVRDPRAPVPRIVAAGEERGCDPDVVTEIGRTIRARLLLASFAPEEDRVLIGFAQAAPPGTHEETTLPVGGDPVAEAFGSEGGIETDGAVELEVETDAVQGSRLVVVTFLLDTAFGVQPVLLTRPLRLH